MVMKKYEFDLYITNRKHCSIEIDIPQDVIDKGKTEYDRFAYDQIWEEEDWDKFIVDWKDTDTDIVNIDEITDGDGQ
jgi:hypothetical protein